MAQSTALDTLSTTATAHGNMGSAHLISKYNTVNSLARVPLESCKFVILSSDFEFYLL